MFINYTLDFLGKSQQTFTIDGFIHMVNEPYFVEYPEYISSLIEKIPSRKRSDTLVALYQAKNWDNHERIALVISALAAKSTDVEFDDLARVAAAELQTTEEDSQVSLAITVLPVQVWAHIPRMTMFRVQKIMEESLRAAEYYLSTNSTNRPSATWITNIIDYLPRKSELSSVIYKKLSSNDMDDHNFIANYLLPYLPKIAETGTEMYRCVSAIRDAIAKGNTYMASRLSYAIRFPYFLDKCIRSPHEGLNRSRITSVDSAQWQTLS